MRHIVFFLAALLFLGSAPVHEDRLVDKDEWVLDSLDGQAISTLLDGVGADGLGSERFVVMIHHSDTYLVKLDVMSAYTIAWFRYAPGNQSVAVEYISFPLYEKGSDLFGMLGRLVIDPNYKNKSLQSMNLFNSFLREIVQNRGIAGIEDAKRIAVPLPVGLKNDALLDAMKKYKPSRFYTENGISMVRVSTDGGDGYYWGIKTSKYEMVHCNSDFSLYDDEAMARIKSQILWPVQCAILERETPDDWREDYRKWQEDQPRIYREQQEIRQRLRQKSLDQAQDAGSAE
jgi:hypothetical protein